MSAIDIHDYEKRYESAIRRIKASEIPEANKEAILGFQKDISARGTKIPRVVKYLNDLMTISRLLGKEFKSATRDDIVDLVNRIERKPYSEWTKTDFRIVTKRFYRWLNGSDTVYPDEVKWINTSLNVKGGMLPEELWTEDEVRKLIDAADNPRDKAMIFIVYESGCRIGEVSSRQIKHVQFDEYGAKLMVDGKTGMRRVRLVSSVPSLSVWLSHHPDKDNPDAPLWVGNGCRNKNKPLKYNSIGAIFRKAAQKSCVRKRCNPHMFRHSRATLLAQHLTEAQLKQVFGWTQSSKMASVYVHLSGRDTDDAMLQFNGIKTGKAEEKESILKPKKCPRCELVNSVTSKFCNRCAAPLDIQTALSIEEKTNGLAQSFAEAMGKGAGITDVARRPDGLSQEDLEKLAKLVVGYMK